MLTAFSLKLTRYGLHQLKKMHNCRYWPRSKKIWTLRTIVEGSLQSVSVHTR